LASIKRLIREVQGPEDPEIRAYYRPYSDELERARTKPMQEKDFLRICASSPVVLVGDFHTLDQAQGTFLHLLEGLEALGITPTIGLEMVDARDDDALAHYVKGRLRDCDFLENIGYFKDWGFDFSHYKPILTHARRRRLSVCGINFRGTLAGRDRLMAGRIEALSRGANSAPLLVLVGDLHLAKEHLPAELLKRGLRPPILFQNSETVHMRKLSYGLEPFGWWSLGQGRYLNNNTPPTVKMMTYLTWLEHGGEALQMLYGYCRPGSEAREGELDIAETVRTYIRLLKSVFDLYLKTDEDYQVFMYKDLEFLDNPFFKKNPGKAYRSIILDGRAVYIHRHRTLYIPMLDVNRTVQETMHYLMRAPLPFGKTHNAFMNRIHYFTSGYLGSKLINPMRHSPSLEEMEKSVRSYKRVPSEKERQKLQRQWGIYNAVLRFFRILDRRSEGLMLEWEPLLKLDRDSAFALSEQIGRTLGDFLYATYNEGKVSAKELKMYIFQQQNPIALGWPSSIPPPRHDA